MSGAQKHKMGHQTQLCDNRSAVQSLKYILTAGNLPVVCVFLVQFVVIRLLIQREIKKQNSVFNLRPEVTAATALNKHLPSTEGPRTDVLNSSCRCCGTPDLLRVPSTSSLQAGP
jgi:hypothetical protein